MLFLLASLLACALFTLFVFIMSRDPVRIIFNYPPAIVERCSSLGLVDGANRPGGAAFYARKISALILLGALLGLGVRYICGCTSFARGALTAYALWCIVDWYDALVLDCLWFCHDPRFVIKGTEDMTDAYHDYLFHIRGALVGMLLGVVAAPVAGLVAVMIP